MATPGTQTPSARETLSKIADELQARVRQAGVKAVEDAFVQPAPQQPPTPAADLTALAKAATEIAPHTATVAPAAVPPIAPEQQQYAAAAPNLDPLAQASPAMPLPTATQPLPPIAPAASQPSPYFTPDVRTSTEPTPARPIVVKGRTTAAAWFAMLIALAAAGAAGYQTYLFHQTTEVAQRNYARSEFVRACRDLVGRYFQVKSKVSTLMPAADRGNIAGASRVTEMNRQDAQAAVAQFGEASTYVANFQNDVARARDSELARALKSILDNARNTQLSDVDKTFEPADRLFSQMTDECAKASRTMRM
jgi:hypothetical protein